MAGRSVPSSPPRHVVGCSRSTEVLFVHYNDLTTDPEREMRRIAEFCDFGGQPNADGDETDAVAWVRSEQLLDIGLSAFARAPFEHLGYI